MGFIRAQIFKYQDVTDAIQNTLLQFVGMLSNKENIEARLRHINETRLYQCIICLDRVKKPRFCTNCKKMMCLDHFKRLGDKCPHCRNCPFELEEDPMLSKIIEGIELKERELEKSTKEFECLVENCKFTGNYVAMLKHRRKAHIELSIDDILYDEKLKHEREKRKAIMIVIKNMAVYQQLQLAYFCSQNPKMPPPGEVKKHPDFPFAKRMIDHIAECCPHGSCTRVYNTNWGTYIGRAKTEHEEFFFTECPMGRQLNEELGWNYLDPKH